MKNLYTKILSVLLVAAAAAAFSGCNDNNTSSSQISTTASVTAAVTAKSEDTTAASNGTDDIKADLKSLHSYDMENGDEFAGAWQIVDGEGSGLENFVYLFDGNGKASMIIDTVGYMGKYEVKKSDGKTTFITQLIFGLNGEYSCEFSDDNSKVKLTNNENKTTTTIQRLASFDCIPIPEKNPKIDKDLLGAWKSENGEYYYFDESGIMYCNQFNTMFIYATYSAENSVITSTYMMEGETVDEYDYSVDGDTLKLDEYEYKRIPASELE